MKKTETRTRTVVVVDDEPDFARLVKALLEEHDFRVYVSFNGREGIEKILEVKPDLVLLDILMPVIQGYDVCRYLKTQQDLTHTKIVFLTSLSKELDKRWGMATGADGYLTKPISGETLIDTVQSVLQT